MPMATLMNPRGRRKKARTAAQKAATRRMIAANRARRSRPRKAARRRSNPVTPLSVMAANPKRRRSARSSAKAASSAGRILRYRRTNPNGRFGMRNFVQGQLIPSAIGGAGALTLDILMTFLPLPPMLKTGALRPVTRVAGALALGFAAGAISNRRIGEQVAAGALTVVLYDTMRAFLPRIAPALPLGATDSEIAYYSAGQQVGETEQVPYQVGETLMLPSEQVGETGEYVGSYVEG